MTLRRAPDIHHYRLARELSVRLLPSITTISTIVAFRRMKGLA